MNRRPLFLQFFYTYVPIILAGLFLLIVLINQFIRDFYYGETRNDLRDRVELIGYWVESNQAKSSLQTFAEESGARANMRVTIVDKSGNVLGDSHENPNNMDNHGSRPEIMDAIKNGYGTSIRHSRTLRKSLMYYSIPIEVNQQTWVVRVSTPLDTIDKSINSLQNKVLILGVFITGGLLVLSFFFSKKMAKPLEHMKHAAERFSKEDLSRPIALPNTKELASLAESLNTMASNLDKRLKTITTERNEREAVLTSMREGVIAIDAERKIISINDAACLYLELVKDESIGKNVDGKIRDTGFLDFYNELTQSTTPLEKEIRIKKNKDRFFFVSGDPLNLENESIGVLMVMSDITHQKQLEKIRQDFVANVSHELKTPITSMIGYMEILSNGHASEAQTKTFIEKALNQSKRLNDIVDDLLKLSRIESQEEDSSIELISQPVHSIIEGAVDDVKSFYPEKEIPIQIRCNQKLEVNADAQLLREAIINLLDNAVKYGHNNSTITLKCEASEILKIHIHNEGPPIPEKYKERIFQRFYRLDKSRSRDAGGTGLGLAIVKHIVYVHGGEVSVDSSAERGTTFSISLPV